MLREQLTQRPRLHPGTGPAALELRAVSKAFRSERTSWRRRRPWRSAVRDVSLAVTPGEVYGIIGSNGSGKSTLIRMISTLLLPDSGVVSVFGHDAVRHPGDVRPLVNRVSADPSFFRAMSPMENLAFFGRAYGLSGRQAADRSREILDGLHMERHRLNEPMQRLSRGQQQKVAVARAFLTAPRLLLLDEPTTGLDVRSKRDVQRYVDEARGGDGVTVLLTTHDMAEAELLCDRIAFLAGGRLVAEGTPDELKRGVAERRRVAAVDMEEVFIELAGRDLDEDEEEDEAQGEVVLP